MKTDRERFRKEVCDCVNRYSMEGGSNTPDFIIADYLTDCLEAFNRAVEARQRWYGEKKTQTVFNAVDFGLSLFRKRVPGRRPSRGWNP